MIPTRAILKTSDNSRVLAPILSAFGGGTETICSPQNSFCSTFSFLVSTVSFPTASTPAKQDPSPGNGGVGPNYSWTQTLGELTLVVPVKEGIQTKQVALDVKGQHLRLGLRGEEPILDGTLHAAIVDQIWQLDREESTIEVTLEKQDRMNWWGCVFEGHPEIDIAKVEPDNSKLDDLDGETRGMVEKMMYDQRQKAAGKPTSDEQQKMKMFEQFKKQHPELDFSNAKMQ